MSPEGVQQVVALIAGETAEEDVLTRVQRLCALCVESTGTSGAALVITSTAHRSTVWATDPVAEQLEELQLTYSEGPVVDAISRGRPALAPDLLDWPKGAWPLFAPAAAAIGARALFALPLQIGRIRPGALSLYRSAAGEMDHLQRLKAELCAEASTLLLTLDRGQAGPEAFGWAMDDRSRFQPQVHRAVGVLTAQLGLAAPDAFARLCAHAFRSDTSIGQVSEEIVAGQLRLERDVRLR